MAPSALPTATGRQARARIVRLLCDRRSGVAGVLALTAASTVATLAGPALIGVVLDAATGTGDGRKVVDRAALAFAVLAATGAGLRYLAAVRAAVVGESAMAELRTEVFDHALSVPADIIEAAGIGDLVSRVTGDVTVLARAVRWTVPASVFATVEIVFTLVALVLVDWRLAAVAVVAGAPLAAIGGRWYFRRAPARYRAEREAHAELTGSLLQAYLGAPTLAAYRASHRHRRLAAALGRRVIDAELVTTSARNRLRPAVSASLAASLAAVVATGAALVDAGTVTVGAVTAAALYVIRLFDPVGTLLEEADELQQATAATARLVGVTLVPADPVTSGPPPQPVDIADGRAAGVELCGVDFAYQPGVPVLGGVDLHVAPGERVVLVGPSGAGKTTLAKLVTGALNPDAGDARVGGRAVLDLPVAERARLIAMVPQEGHVFARSVADNVRLARPGVTDEDVRDALVAVDALGWVDTLPDGLATVVGAGHAPLTPPQAQQLGLARLVCADPAVVVLDEVTADLDPSTAARTERHLHTALAGRTVLTVAHRLDAAVHADRVVVLDAGTVVATGTHAELLAAGGTYAELWQHWTADRGLCAADALVDTHPTKEQP